MVNFPRKRLQRTNLEHKRIVEAAGAVYVPGMMGKLVLFNSRRTGSTLALPEAELTVDNVRAHVLESDLKWHKD